jgi:hypothetical protein
VLAILLAVTIAEPLTLRIFQNTLDSTPRPPGPSSLTSTKASCRPAIRCPGNESARRPAPTIT